MFKVSGYKAFRADFQALVTLGSAAERSGSAENRTEMGNYDVL